ncbi:phage tail protein I [Bengtsoniella intestinalis]|uniref:phage tail protein I n=1 Tax=Bengtsoniella intestinalis TaxID=3073143 RepID=UPI00391FA303
MSDFGLSVENLLAALPDALKNDASILALGEVIATQLAQRTDEINSLTIYGNIDQMDETLLDILAVDFKVDWWDTEYTVDEKRQTLKDSWAVHRSLGTKGAVEQAISAIYAGTTVSEWFEYDGDPFHYKLLVDAIYENVDPDKHQRVLERVKYYQNLRSVLDGIEYTAAPDGECQAYVGIAVSGISISLTKEVAIYGLD